MKKITFPLKLGTKSPEVSNLQEALQLLLDKAFILQNDEATRQEISAGLQGERTAQMFGDFSAKVVSIFQKEQNLKSSNIDKKTVNALNKLLQEKEVLPSTASTDTAVLDTRYTVLCCVVDSQGKIISGLRIEAYDQDPKSPHDPLGEPATTDTRGMVIFRFKSSDFTEHPGEYGPDLYFKVYLKETLLDYSLSGILNDKGVIRGFQQQREPIVIRIDKNYVVTGVIVQDNGLPAQNMDLFIYNLGFGGNDTLLGSPKTDTRGCYSLTYDPGATVVNLELRIKNPQDPGKEIPLSKPRFAAKAHEIINLVAPSMKMAAEYQRISADLKLRVEEVTRLADVRENAERHDLTMLNQATGWDARLIALASKAGRMSTDTKVNISQEALYGLFRLGLPSDKSLLAQMNVDVLIGALEKAKEAGIIDLSDELKEEFKTRFETFACETLLELPVPGTNSTYGSLLKETKLDDKGPESDKSALKFASAYLRYSRGADLWVSALKAGLNSGQIQKLQLQGKLAFLTGNSVKLTSHLQNKIQDSKNQVSNIENLIERSLVDGNYFLAGSWEAELRGAAEISPDEPIDKLSEAKENSLKELIPLLYTSEKLEDSFKAYTEDMARKVRFSYPTQVICQMVQNGEDVFNLGEARSITATFMKNAATKGFRLGQTPVESFIDSNPEILKEIDLDTVDVAKQNVKTLYRIYQITPSNEAMTTMRKLGFNSAYDVVALPRETFLERYGREFPSIQQAKLTYSKAEQVNSTIFNVLTTIKKLDSDIQMYAVSAPANVKNEVKKKLIAQSPTMESLFGSLDFCECEHCRSVFSPAAYLVDLLQFIDKNADSETEIKWKKQLDEWPEKHNGATYPFRNLDEQTKYRSRWKEKNPNSNSEPDTEKTPYEVLFERRPDITNIPLTCENTNTALPYIDIVNEILEYYVANETLTEEAAHDTGDATTAELLAEPQNVISKAYNTLQQVSYPINLPFDLWLETVRSFCNYFETPLWQLLEVFRQGDKLFVPTQPYDRNSIFIEYLGLSHAEYEIFTNPNPMAEWYKLYGYQDNKEATEVKTNADTGQRIDLNSAKTLSRRLGISYKEIVEIIQTRFVNPNLVNLEALQKYGITIRDVMYYTDKEHKDFYNLNRDLLEKKRADLSPENQKRFDALKKEEWEQLNEIQEFENRLDNLTAKYPSSGLNFKDWMEKKLEEKAFDNILVLADQRSSCSFDSTTLRYANGENAKGIDFLKINLFVRLWHKLGWTIEETDLALQAFIPEQIPFNEENLEKQPLKTALIYLAHLKFIDEEVSFGVQSRIKLITLWADLATTGKNPLYAQLFLNKSVLKSGEVFDEEAKKYVSIFDDPLGVYLSEAGLEAIADRVKHEVSEINVKPEERIDSVAFRNWPKLSINYDDIRNVQSLSYQGVLTDETKQTLILLFPQRLMEQLLEAVQTKAEEFKLIKGHMLALQGALGLTANEITQIIKDAGKFIDTAKLSLENISLLYRYGLLAKALKLSISEMIVVKQLSGLDPFKALSASPLTTLSEDYPFTQTLRFIEVVEQIKESGLKIEDLDYLLCHCFDETGKYRPNKDGNLALIKTLADGINSIHNEYAVPVDPGSMGDDVLRQKLGLVLSSSVVERLLAMINGTAEFTVTKKIEEFKGEILNPEDFKNEPSIRKVIYNETSNEQKLTFRGVLFDKEKAKLTGKYPSSLFASLLDEVQNNEREFFSKYLHNYFDDYSQLFALEPDEAASSEIHSKLLWAFGPHLILSKPDILTDDLLGKYLKFILPPDVADTFLKMFTGEIEFTAVQKNVSPNEKLDQKFNEPYIKVSYNEELKEQTLTFQGVLLNTKSEELKKKYSSPLFSSLLDEVQAQARKYYEQNLLEFFTSADFDLLFKPIPQELSEEEKQKLKREKYNKLAQEFLLYIWVLYPETFTQVLLQEALKLVFSTDIADTFSDMLKGEKKYTAVLKNIEPCDQLDQKIFTEPYINVSYSNEQKEQTLTFKGILLDAQSAELKAKYSSQIFASLIDEVQKQARTFYEQNLQSSLAGSSFNLLFTVVPDGLNSDLKQKLMRHKKTRLIQAFLPVLQRQLTRQFILQKLTAQLGADPVLVEALVKDKMLLGDPQPLEEAFASTAEYGLKVTFFKDPDGRGEPLATLIFSDADTSLKDKNNIPLKPSGAECALFEGYLEVPTPGAYRFYAVFMNENDNSNNNSQISLSFYHLPKPLLNGKTNESGEISEYLELKSGTLYRFALKISNLKDGKASLLVQSETLPKGSLSQLKLYPQTAIERTDRALILLSKVLQVIQSFNLNEREVRYLLTHPADFDGLNLSKLPTSKVDNTSEGSKALFSQFLRLAGYTRLKRDLTGGTDDLIGIFEIAALDRVCPLISKLTRRADIAVIDTSRAMSISSFPNELAVQRLWEALQVMERFGVPIGSIVSWTGIVNPVVKFNQHFAIAHDLKEAIKARFEQDKWQLIAQPISDKLRQRQRDALVAHTMHQQGFARVEQLYEYFLIDPGMEPVVQTTRIRLAIGSVQLFIQRCLLNLEEQVHPSVITTEHWQWMKRYRIWEANRKIFLFPENWLEPEFRDDKTHLFSELEGSLLKGDVSDDLVEDAFFNYLTKLEELARLEIVAMHRENDGTLHVIGRTYSEPHKYFYRRYDDIQWTPWEPVTAGITGNHLAPVVWRNRLYLFWVTFTYKADENVKAKMSELKTALGDGLKKSVEVQLHWSEYLQGKWSTPESGEFVPVKDTEDKLKKLTVPIDFEPKNVLVYARKEEEETPDKNGNGVCIVLEKNDGPKFKHMFYLAGRNSAPELIYNNSSVLSDDKKYSSKEVINNRYSCKNQLKVNDKELISLPPDRSFTILACNNDTNANSDSDNLAFFYQDNVDTFFVKPDVKTLSISAWSEWILRPDYHSGYDFSNWSHLDDINLEDVVPSIPDMGDPGPDFEESYEAIYDVRPGEDLMINPRTVIEYDGELIGQKGLVDAKILSSGEAANAVAEGAILVKIQNGTDYKQEKSIVIETDSSLERAGLMHTIGGINVVGNSGLKWIQAKKTAVSTASTLKAHSGGRRTER